MLKRARQISEGTEADGERKLVKCDGEKEGDLVVDANK